MTPEIAELVRELEEFQTNEPGFPQIFTRAAATLRRLSERCAEAERERDEFAKVLASPLADEVVKQADRAESAEAKLGEAVDLIEDLLGLASGSGEAGLDFVERYRASVSGSTEAANG